MTTDASQIRSLISALPAVAHESTGDMIPMGPLYGAVRAQLEAEGQPGIPLGDFTRILKFLGFPVLFRRDETGARRQHVRNLAFHSTERNNT